ncbi:acyltransferase family protein [Pseudoduganella eburnea]|uniref:Acyltransferase family protein n=1 Tax=Massilia eburnea TaxID=1776165 RepID=A0A6L6QMM9_9BURK|nr:acyltransferase [Massilia eburnea]MTW13688.1 acyltransferase family protein [Massilia eburnea]
MNRSSRIHGLDTLRALAIMLVFANHYMGFVSFKPTFGWFSEIGWAGVDLFFALSGYLIGNQVFAALRGPGLSLPHFYARRLLRTVPAFLFVLALYAWWPYWAGGLPHAPWWKYLTFTLNFDLKPGTLFSHAWSLCVEEQFYLLLPPIALALAAIAQARRSVALALGWAALASAVAAGMWLRHSWWAPSMDLGGRGSRAYYTLIYYSTLSRFDELLAGVALAMLRNFHPALWQAMTRHGNAMLAAGAALTALAFWLFIAHHFSWGMSVFGYPLLGVAFAAMLLAALSEGSLLQRTRIPGMGAIAVWSYSIYLTHKQLCVLLAEYWAPDEPLSIALMIAASIFAGWLLYFAVEAPFMKLRERFIPSNHKRRPHEATVDSIAAAT